VGGRSNTWFALGPAGGPGLLRKNRILGKRLLERHGLIGLGGLRGGHVEKD
jgi:hypothetical protein